MPRTPKEERIKEIKDEFQKFSKLEAVSLSEGGQILFKGLMQDAVSAIDTLGSKYAHLTHLEFISLCAELKTKLDLARAMSKTTKNKKQAEEDLKQALLEE